MPAVVTAFTAHANRLVAAGFPHPPAIAAANVVAGFRRPPAGVVVGLRRAVAAGDDRRVRLASDDLRGRAPIGGGEAAPALAPSAALLWPPSAWASAVPMSAVPPVDSCDRGRRAGTDGPLGASAVAAFGGRLLVAAVRTSMGVW